MRRSLLLVIVCGAGLWAGACKPTDESAEPATEKPAPPALPEPTAPAVEPVRPVPSAPAAPAGPTDPAVAAMGAEARRVYWLINDARRREGLEMLAVRADLENLARQHNQAMLQTRLLSHRSGAGDIGNRCTAAGIAWNYAAECIARFGASDDPARQALELWLASQPDRENLLNNVYREVGVAAAKDPKTGLWYVTAILCRRNIRYENDPPAKASGPSGQ